MSKREDLSNTRINEWEVLRYLGNRQYECRCSCGAIKAVSAYSLKSGKSKSCGHAYKGNRLTKGDRFGEWEVEEDLGYGKVLCRCSCGKQDKVSKYSLINRLSKSCGHATTRKPDLEVGETFENWEVLGKANDEYYECMCKKCGSVYEVSKKRLRNGSSTECRKCLLKEAASKRKDTKLRRYGEVSTYHLNAQRTEEQQIALESAEELRGFIERNNLINETVHQIAIALDVTDDTILKAVHRYNLENIVTVGGNKESTGEVELYNYVASIVGDENIKRHVKDAITPYELDIYIEEKGIAIEYNGIYWHSSQMKDKMYHQNKTLACARKGIKLIHIWENEWVATGSREKIKRYLADMLSDNKRILYGRQTEVHEIDQSEATEFLNEYHLQGSMNSRVNIGCHYNNELIGVMSFSYPRYDRDRQWELTRMAWKSGVAVVGGSEKLFKYFIRAYNPDSIICYSDISKFRGNAYARLGFKCTCKDITAPGYEWVNKDTMETLSRYQTQKHKLVEAGLGGIEETEDEIMTRLGYLKIFNCGNLRMSWTK